MTRANRNYLKERGIRQTGRPLGRKPKKAVQSRYQRAKSKKEQNERNRVEGKLGRGKDRYDLNKIKAGFGETHESWVASIVFVMNILQAMEDIFCQIFKERLFQLIFQRKLHEKLSPFYYFVKVA